MAPWRAGQCAVGRNISPVGPVGLVAFHLIHFSIQIPADSDRTLDTHVTPLQRPAVSGRSNGPTLFFWKMNSFDTFSSDLIDFNLFTFGRIFFSVLGRQETESTTATDRKFPGFSVERGTWWDLEPLEWDFVF